jgi:hypothetical protein
MKNHDHEFNVGSDDDYDEDMKQELKNPDFAKEYLQQVLEEDTKEQFEAAIDKLLAANQYEVIHGVLMNQIEELHKEISKKKMASSFKSPKTGIFRYASYYARYFQTTKELKEQLS